MIASVLAAFVVGLTSASGATPGMTAPAVSKAWHVRVVPRSEPGLDCATALVHVGDAWGSVFFTGDRFRAVFLTGGVVTDTGIRIGSPVAAVRKAYGSRLTSRPDKYAPHVRNYFVKGRWQLRFDVSDGKVTRISFGDKNVRLVEGCS